MSDGIGKPRFPPNLSNPSTDSNVVHRALILNFHFKCSRQIASLFPAKYHFRFHSKLMMTTTTMMIISLLLPLLVLSIGNTPCLFANAFGVIHRHVPSVRRIPQLSAAASTTTTSIGNVEKYDDLIRWFLSASDKSYLSPKVGFRPSTRGGLVTGGYGTFANDDLVEGELLFRIPRNCCVTLDDALTDLECGPAFQKLLEQFGPGSDTVIVAGYLAKEYLLLKEYDRRLQDGAKPDDDTPEMRRLSKIKFSPYIRTLPWERGVNAQEHVLFWEDEDVEALLKGSLAYDDAIEIRSTVSIQDEDVTLFC